MPAEDTFVGAQEPLNLKDFPNSKKSGDSLDLDNNESLTIIKYRVYSPIRQDLRTIPCPQNHVFRLQTLQGSNYSSLVSECFASVYVNIIEDPSCDFGASD